MLVPESSRENIVQYEPREMQVPFTGEEIGDAAKKLKNGKSAGPDEIQLELIKYALPLVFDQIAEIYNDVEKKGDSVIEFKFGLLRPLQKP